MMNEKLLFYTKAYTYLANEITTTTGIKMGEVVTSIFPDGEIYHRIETPIKNKDVFLIGGTINDEATLELYDLAYGIIQLGAKSLQLFIPYFGYSTMEREVKKGEVVKAKSRALLLSSLPQPPNGLHIILFDLHSEGIPYYFEKNIQTTHLYGKKIIMDCARELCASEFVLAATDAGRAKWVESLAAELSVQAAFLFKKRISGTETTITGMNADVKNKTVIIYDDMLRTGGSLMQAAKAYYDAGANAIFAIVTHGLFSNNALEKIEKQQIIKKVICTNSHPNSIIQTSKILNTVCITPIINILLS